MYFLRPRESTRVTPGSLHVQTRGGCKCRLPWGWYLEYLRLSSFPPYYRVAVHIGLAHQPRYCH